jgi:amino acid adenylation domain-containing protein
MQPVDKRKNIENIYPLSPMQQGMLFHTLLTPQAGVYLPQVCLHLQGKLDVDAMQNAWQEVIRNHSVLRSAFYWEQRDRLFQVVFRQVEFPWQFLDWQSIPPHEQDTKLAELLECDRILGFDLKQPPLMRLALIQSGEDKFTLIWTQHHLILDGWSLALIIQEVFQRYYNTSSRYHHSRPYGEYIAWLQQQNRDTAKIFWQKQLQGFTEPSSLPSQLFLNPKAKLEPDNNSVKILLDPEKTVTIQNWAKQHQLTLNTVLQGAFALLLSRYCNTTDVVFGATSSGRPANLPGVESMVGLFINTLPVRVQVSPEANLVSWLQKLQIQQSETLNYEYTSLLEIQEWSELPRGSALFDSILVFENYPVDISAVKGQEDLRIADIKLIEKTNFPISILVSVGNQLSLELKYDSHKFTPAAMKRLLEHLCILLEGMTANYQQNLATLPLLTQQELELVTKWNQTQTDYPQKCIHNQFEAQVERTPDNIAVIFGEQKLTYKELNQRSNQLAHYLQNLGVQPETPVGICLERSLEMVIGILGILKAGAAYVPLDPDYPAQRLEYIISETQVPVILTNNNLVLSNNNTVCLNKDWLQIAQQPDHNITTSVNPDNAIYVIYTSGSTGNPKGVINTHRGISNRLWWMQQQYGLEIGEPVLQKTPFSFDVSVWEFFWTLLNGACLVIAKPGGHQDLKYLVEIIESEKITTLHFVPAILGVFLEELEKLEKLNVQQSSNPNQKKLSGVCQSLKRVICSGEALSVPIQNRFFQLLNAELHNLYGPTEAAIDVTYWQCQPNSELHTVPIGKPIANTQIYLLDSHMQPVPIGVPGELYIGGVGVARGYWGRPDLTNEKFIIEYSHPPTPHSPLPTPLYKTGDLARYLDDGNIEYLGRLDNQVKIRGLRIELGEIETQLNLCSGVQQAIVLLNEQAENPRLVAYVVFKSSENASNIPQVREFLAEKLPEYMIPSVFVELQQLPLLPNGKVNRKALPAPETVRDTSKIVLPRNPTEGIIANIWVDVLRIESIGVMDNFFELGGNSLSAIRVTARLREAFQLDLSLGSLFEKPTIATLAEYIEILQKSIQQMQANSSINITSNTKTGRKEIEI